MDIYICSCCGKVIENNGHTCKTCGSHFCDGCHTCFGDHCQTCGDKNF